MRSTYLKNTTRGDFVNDLVGDLGFLELAVVNATLQGASRHQTVDEDLFLLPEAMPKQAGMR